MAPAPAGAVVAMLWVLAFAAVGVTEALAYVAPVLVLLLPLLQGRYPGDALLQRPAQPSVARLRPPRLATPPTPPMATLPRGGVLMASSLAGRAPPTGGWGEEWRPKAPSFAACVRGADARSRFVKSKTAVLMGVGVLAAPTAAQAHVTLQPDRAHVGGFTRLDVRVPNEEDDKGTEKVEVRMPPGFVFASYEAVPGWKVAVKKRKLAKPVKSEDGEVTEEVSSITWTADGAAAAIAPGQFRDFGLSVGVPKRKVGSKLTFKALQTYQGGDVVRWIGPPDSEKPAPQVALIAAEEEGHSDGAKADEKVDAEPVAAAAASTGGDDDGPSTGLVIVALAVGALGLATGVAGLLTARRRPA